MALLHHLRPARRLVFPFTVVCAPAVWFVYGDAGVRIEDGQRVLTPLSRTVALAVLALLASYVVAVVVASAVRSRDGFDTPWGRILFRPTNGTLLALAVLWSVVVGYVALDSAVDLPYESELVVGIPLLWPLLVALISMYALGNAVLVLRAFAVQATFTTLGFALSAAWLFLLATGIDRVVSTVE